MKCKNTNCPNCSKIKKVCSANLGVKRNCLYGKSNSHKKDSAGDRPVERIRRKEPE